MMGINQKTSVRTLPADDRIEGDQSVNPTENTMPTVDGTADEIARNLTLIRDEIADTAAKIDVQEMAGLAGHLGLGGHLGQTGRVFVAGAGRSGLVLRMAAMRLMHLGMTVHVAGDTTTPAISSGDLLLVASGSGTTSGVVKSAIIPAAQKTDHGSSLSRQYSGSLFEQVLFLATEAIFQTLWDNTDEQAEELWLRHANLE